MLFRLISTNKRVRIQTSELESVLPSLIILDYILESLIIFSPSLINVISGQIRIQDLFDRSPRSTWVNESTQQKYNTEIEK